MQGAVEPLVDQLLDVGILGGGVVPGGLGQRVLPLDDASQECNVLTGEVIESRELLQRSRVALENGLQSTHGQDTVARVAVAGLDRTADGLESGDDGSDHGRARVERLEIGVGSLGLDLPLREEVEGLLTEDLVAHHLPARKEDGEDFDEKD